jgi:hypothetical protein
MKIHSQRIPGVSDNPYCCCCGSVAFGAPLPRQWQLQPPPPAARAAASRAWDCCDRLGLQPAAAETAAAAVGCFRSAAGSYGTPDAAETAALR